MNSTPPFSRAATIYFDRRINEAEAALAAAGERATREAKADILDSQAAALPDLFEEYLEVCGRFAQALAEIDVFDAQGGSGLVLQTRNELEGARASIFSQLKFIADELRRDPPLPRPEPPQLPTGVRPRFMLDRDDAHEPWISSSSNGG
jgi:hypothetical protein